MVQIGRVKGARPERAGARPAGVSLVSLWGAVSSIEWLPLAYGPRKVLRALRRLKPSMGASPKKSAQKRGASHRKGVRCAANLRSWRRGLWTRAFGQELAHPIQVNPVPSVVGVTAPNRDSRKLKSKGGTP